MQLLHCLLQQVEKNKVNCESYFACCPIYCTWRIGIELDLITMFTYTSLKIEIYRIAFSIVGMIL